MTAGTSRVDTVQSATATVLSFNRRVPGDGDIPLEWLMGSLLDAGYNGLFELEVLGPAIAAEGYSAAMQRGCEWISHRLTQLGV